MLKQYDVIVVGAGHAGCEAANAAALMGSSVLLITMNMNTIAQMSCNPAMGGVAKGQIVREIDALGGGSGIVSDKSAIQFRMLNLSKGPAMWSPRTQNDRMLFASEWRLLLERNKNVDFWQDTCSGLIIEGNTIIGVHTALGMPVYAKSVVLTNGTFLNGLIHLGEKQFGGGRAAERSSTGITEELIKLGFESGRMKTGTPPRVDGRSLDYSQMELRIAAFLSGDKKLIEIFKKGEDVHASVAASVFKVPINEVTSDMRRKAKVINFGILYGMGVLALKQNLGTSREEAQTFMNEYFETFSTLAAYIDQVKADAARKGYTETFFGRRRYFEGLDSKIPYIRASAERMAFNAPIQGTEADVIKLALIEVDAYIKKEKLEDDVYPLLQVHDELVFEIRDDKAEEVSKKILEIMESVVNPKDIYGVMLRAERSLGANWGELK